MQDKFSPYQRFVVALLAFLQFTVVLDFMILSPLGALLIEKLHITPAQFGHVVSAYAFSAGISGLLAAGIADKFDRKKLLLFFYVGFLGGTLFCGLAPTYELLLAARIVTGIFGGVISSIGSAIVVDLFPVSMRGRVMGFVQTSFSASQILGLPIGLFLATHLGWHAPFLMIVGVGALAGLAIVLRLQPITAHLTAGAKQSAVAHLVHTATRGRYLVGFSATILLAVGGFMLMPFASTFIVQNLGTSVERLPLIYMVTGVSAMIAGPLLGRASDAIGRYPVFVFGSVLTAVMVVCFTNLSHASLGLIIGVNVALYLGVSARIVSSFAMTSALPDMPDRGAYMAINSSLQQLAGGIAAWIASLLVHQASPNARLEGFPIVGWVSVGTVALTIALMFNVHRIVKRPVSA